MYLSYVAMLTQHPSRLGLLCRHRRLQLIELGLSSNPCCVGQQTALMVGFARQMLSGQPARQCVQTAALGKGATKLRLKSTCFDPLHRWQLRRCAASASSSQDPGSSTTAASAQMEHKHTNRLAKEQSPYLLQHAHNPVSALTVLRRYPPTDQTQITVHTPGNPFC
jgi:hypothetical protein